jgi:hypothetical protein
VRDQRVAERHHYEFMNYQARLAGFFVERNAAQFAFLQPAQSPWVGNYGATILARHRRTHISAWRGAEECRRVLEHGNQLQILEAALFRGLRVIEASALRLCNQIRMPPMPRKC